jgi:hypothetical protein
MREIIKSWLQKMEFITGLKQIRELSVDDLKMLVDFLESKAKEYSWMTDARLNEIMKRGMEGGYGEFYHMNVKTLSVWCNTYYEHHKQKIMVEQFPKTSDPAQSEEEVQYWKQVARKMFLDSWEKAKTGEIRPLAEWLPSTYDKCIEAGLLNEGDYPFDENRAKKELRIEKGLGFLNSMLVSRKKESIWRRFIQDCVRMGVDLPNEI